MIMSNFKDSRHDIHLYIYTFSSGQQKALFGSVPTNFLTNKTKHSYYYRGKVLLNTDNLLLSKRTHLTLYLTTLINPLTLPSQKVLWSPATQKSELLPPCLISPSTWAGFARWRVYSVTWAGL